MIYIYIVMRGGSVVDSQIIQRIQSIGFEFETGDLTPIQVISPGVVKPMSDTGSFFYRPEHLPTVVWEHAVTADVPTGNDILNLNGFLNRVPTDDVRLVAHLGDNGIKLDPRYLATVRQIPIFDVLSRTPLYHTEHHFTYKFMGPVPNAIIESLVHAATIIKTQLSHYRFQELRVVSHIKQPDMIAYPSSVVLFSTDDNYPWYVTPKVYTDPSAQVRWTIQMTVGIDMREVSELINYLAYGTQYPHIPQVSQLYNKMNGYLSHVMLETGNQHSDYRDVQSWFYLTILHAVQFKQDKYSLYFALRHIHADIINQFTPEKQRAIIQTLMLAEPDIAQIVLRNEYMTLRDFYIRILQRKEADTGVTKFQFTYPIVLIEVRDFNNQLKHLMGVKSGEVTLTNILSLLQPHRRK